jgi:hypothetical protein
MAQNASNEVILDGRRPILSGVLPPSCLPDGNPSGLMRSVLALDAAAR